MLAAIALVAAALSPGSPPPLAAACGSTSGVIARPTWLTTDDGVRLYAIEAGRGRSTVVLAHQGGSSLCGELAYVRRLTSAGFRVLAFDFRGYGASASPAGATAQLELGRDLAAAVARSRADGAAKVFVIGASMGGAAAVQNGASLPVDGIVSLSGTRLWRGYGINHPESLPRLRSPFLYVGSRSDSNAPLREALSIFRRIGSADKQTAFYRGSWHGWSLVQDAPFAVKARALVLAWLRRHIS
jgi:esterase/lipase